MSKTVEFIQIVAAVIVATGIIIGTATGAYAMLDEEFRFATIGWVNNVFGKKIDFNLLTSVTSNINYYEKKRCRGIALDDSEHAILEHSYEFYAEIADARHRFKSMTRPEICRDRLSPPTGQ